MGVSIYPAFDLHAIIIMYLNSTYIFYYFYAAAIHLHFLHALITLGLISSYISSFPCGIILFYMKNCL